MQSWGSAVVWIDILRGQVLWLGEPPHGLSLDLLKVMVVYPSGTLLQSYMVVALAGSKCLLWLKVASPHHSWEPSMATTSWKSPPLTLTLAAEPRGGGGVHSEPWQPEIWVSLKLIAIALLNPQENSWEQNWRFDTLFPLAFSCNSCPSCSLCLWKVQPIKARISRWP